jgi:hypothetical protein
MDSMYQAMTNQARRPGLVKCDQIYIRASRFSDKNTICVIGGLVKFWLPNFRLVHFKIICHALHVYIHAKACLVNLRMYKSNDYVRTCLEHVLDLNRRRRGSLDNSCNCTTVLINMSLCVSLHQVKVDNSMTKFTVEPCDRLTLITDVIMKSHKSDFTLYKLTSTTLKIANVMANVTS